MTQTASPGPSVEAAQWWVQVRGQAYGPYSEDQLAQFVREGRVRPATPVSNDPQQGWNEARKFPALMAPIHAAAQNAAAPAEIANIFIYAEIHSTGWNRFMAALESMGLVCELSPGLWLVRTKHSAGVMRNTLSQTLERGDRFVVMDATRDRVAWFNLGPELDARIKEVWNAPLTDRSKK